MHKSSKTLQASGAASGEAVSVIFEGADGKTVPRNPADGCYVSSGTFSIRLSHDKARVTTKTRGVISPLGEIIAHDVSFDPIVSHLKFGIFVFPGQNCHT